LSYIVHNASLQWLPAWLTHLAVVINDVR